MDPENCSAFYNRATAYAKREKFGKAIRDFTRAIELNAEHLQAYDGRGQAFAQIERIEEVGGGIRHQDQSDIQRLFAGNRRLHEGNGMGYFEIKRLVVLLKIPEAISIPIYGDRYSSVEGICIVLFRISYSRRWKELEPVFNRHSSARCRIFHYIMHRVLLEVKNRIMFSSRTLSRHHL